MLIPLSTAWPSISASSSLGEVKVLDRRDVLLELRDAAGADQRRGDARIAQRPGDRELSERLPTACGDLVQRPDPGDVLVGDQALAEGLPDAHPRVLRHAVQVAVSQQALPERREHDRTDAAVVQHVEQLSLDPAVQQRVGGLVDQQRRAERAEDLDRFDRALGAVGADSDIQRLALPDGGVEGAHRLVQWGLRVNAMRVEDVDVVEPHPPKALIEAPEEILA